MKNKLSQNFDFEDDYIIIEITTQIPDYHVAWLLNHHLGTDFRRIDDFLVYHSDNESVTYSLFVWSPHEKVDYFLVRDTTSNGALFSVSYLLVQGEEQEDNTDEFLQEMEQVNDIFSIEKIDFAVLQNDTRKRRNLFNNLNAIISDLELHLIELKKKQKQFSGQTEAQETE